MASLLMAPPALAAGEDFCPRFERRPKVYMIGSSTMGSVLGPMLQTELRKRWGVEGKRWGKASSGLARPDYHDWPRKAVGLMRRHNPHMVIVSLGTNDNQGIRTERGWIRAGKEGWEKVYAERVRTMLDTLAGEDRARSIVWIGPTAFDGRTARKMGPVINRILAREIKAFEGHAAYVDAYSTTMGKGGKLVTRITLPGQEHAIPARTSDGIHLTVEAVRHLLADPALAHLEPCLDRARDYIAADKKRKADKRAQARAARLEERAKRKAERIKRRAEARAAAAAAKASKPPRTADAPEPKDDAPSSKGTPSPSEEAQPTKGASKEHGSDLGTETGD